MQSMGTASTGMTNAENRTITKMNLFIMTSPPGLIEDNIVQNVDTGRTDSWENQTQPAIKPHHPSKSADMLGHGSSRKTGRGCQVIERWRGMK